jgi:hypothetical protein
VWWPGYAEANPSDETRNNYATQLDLHVIPKWGAHPLRSLEPRPIEAWVSELRTEGVGAATIIKTLTVFRAILKRAERDLEIDRNPIDVVELAPELGHWATTCLKYYARVFEEFRGLPRCLAVDVIGEARKAVAAGDVPSRYLGDGDEGANAIWSLGQTSH